MCFCRFARFFLVTCTEVVLIRITVLYGCLRPFLAANRSLDGSQLTTAIFESFMTGVRPRDVYVAATVDQGRNVINACEALGIPTLQCLCHRINSAVMWATGINGTASTCKNAEGRDQISRYAALVGMFSHSCTNSDAFRAMQDKMRGKEAEEMEQFRIAATDIEESADAAPVEGLDSELPKSLAFITRNDTR